MKLSLVLPLLVLAMPLAAEEGWKTWDIRLEVPFPKGQSLPQTFVSGTSQLVAGQLNTGSGYILTGSRRIFQLGPVFKLEWTGEMAQMQASGHIQSGTSSQNTTLTQKGFGLGLNAQIMVPLTGLAAEFGVIERFHAYSFQADSTGESQSQNIVQPWMRIGMRWDLPFPVISPYLCASYQQPTSPSKPLVVNSASDLQAYLSAQGSGQEFDRVWTFGVGITF